MNRNNYISNRSHTCRISKNNWLHWLLNSKVELMWNKLSMGEQLEGLNTPLLTIISVEFNL